MSAHTPGPWGIRSTGAVGSDNGSDAGYMICLAGPHDAEGHDTDEGRANARLIAAAPALLAALERLVRGAEEDQSHTVTFAMIYDARAAIAQAKGDK